jgi:hypothetical protein
MMVISSYTSIHNAIIYVQLTSRCRDEKHGKCLRVSIGYRN